MNAGPDTSVEPAIRDVPIFPETKPLDDLLAELQRQRSSIAVVSDEYGRTVGIVTVEDILEEVVGEIEDETDPRAAAMRQAHRRGLVRPRTRVAGRSRGRWDQAAGRVRRLQLDRRLRLLRARPASQAGRPILANGYEIRVESVRENRILAVRIHGSATGEFPKQPDPSESSAGSQPAP